MDGMKKRRETEVYENYWKFTAAHLDITGTKFGNCLQVIVRYIDQHGEELKALAGKKEFARSSLYGDLQKQIAEASGFRGKDPTLSARKAINQYVKIGFVEPFLTGYHPLVKKFLLETDQQRKCTIFSKIFYEASSLASDVTVDNRSLKHVKFLLRTLDENRSLDRRDIMALMITDIRNYPRGYLMREELDLQRRYAAAIAFDERKYNQIAHLRGYLKRFTDLVYDAEQERFFFADDPAVIDRTGGESHKRDGVRHRIYKEELREESMKLYGRVQCFLEKKAYRKLIASHIKAFETCVKEGREDQAYDKNNGLLLSPNVDAYFDENEISFRDDGRILIGPAVDAEIRRDLEKLSLDAAVLNPERKRYLAYHRHIFEERFGETG